MHAAGNQSPFFEDKEDDSFHHKKVDAHDMFESEEGEYPKENGERQSNGVELENRSEKSAERQPDVVDDHPGKSRSTFHSYHTSVILYACTFFQIWYFI